MKRIIFSEDAKAHIRLVPQHIEMNILTAIHRLAESGSGRVKTLQDKDREKRLRVGDYRIRFTEEHPEHHPHPHGPESQRTPTAEHCFAT